MSVPWYLMAKGKGGGYKTASGPIVSINDALAAPLRSLLVNIDPVQAGTGDPSPDNVRPISGWSAVNVWRTGVNVWDEEWESGAIVNGNPVANSSSIRSKNFTACVPSTSIFVVAPRSVILWWYDKDKSYIGQYTSIGQEALVVPEKARYFRIGFPSAYGTTYNHDISINYPATDTQYHSYSGNQYAIQLGQTVYGGTLDVTNGVLTVDRAMVTFTGADSENWDLYATYPNHFQIVVSPPNQKNVNEEKNAISNAYTARIGMSNNNVSVQQGVFSADGNRIRVKDTTCATVAEFKAKLQSLLNGLQVCYVLATPITIPLTTQEITTLAGQNVVWGDCGDVTVEYLSAGGANPDLMKLAVAFMGRMI